MHVCTAYYKVRLSPPLIYYELLMKTIQFKNLFPQSKPALQPDQVIWIMRVI